MRAAKLAALWSLITFAVQMMFSMDPESTLYKRLNIAWCFVLMLFYALLWLLPQKYVGRRPALITYSRVWFLYRFVAVLSFGLMVSNKNNVHSAGEVLFYIE